MNQYFDDTIRKAYLVKFVDPEKVYDVPYLAAHQSSTRNKEHKWAKVKGSDLTENQIAELFKNELL